MRSLIVGLFTFASSSLWAASVTVDFDGSDGRFRSQAEWQENAMVVLDVAYNLGASHYPGGNNLVSARGDTGGLAYRLNNIDLAYIYHQTTTYEFVYQPDGGTSVNFEYGETFDLFSLEICARLGSGACVTPADGVIPPDSSEVFPIIFVGYRADGQIVSLDLSEISASPVVFGSEWQNLWGVRVSSFDNFYGLQYEIDNIVVDAVPIPAAVWLFGSALAGLAGYRRWRAADTRL